MMGMAKKFARLNEVPHAAISPTVQATPTASEASAASQAIKHSTIDTSLSNLNIKIIDVSANLSNHITNQLIKNNLIDISINNLNIQIIDVSTNLTLKQNVINTSNKLSASNVQTTYGLDENMILSEAIVDLRSGLDYNAGSISQLVDTKAPTAYVDQQLLLKQNLIDGSLNKLPSEHVSTSVNSVSSNLKLVLQGLTDSNDSHSASITSLNTKQLDVSNNLTANSTAIQTNSTNILSLLNHDLILDADISNIKLYKKL
jgi:hypothetical protein